MKTTKKLAALLLTLSMAFVLCACSNADSKPTPTAAPSEAGEPSQAPSEAPSPGAAPAAVTPVRRARCICPPTPPSLPMR